MSKTACIILCSLIFAMTAIIVTALIVDGYRDLKYIEAGYTHATLPGSSFPYWVKAGPQ